jgi:hypothetical protein
MTAKRITSIVLAFLILSLAFVCLHNQFNFPAGYFSADKNGEQDSRQEDLSFAVLGDVHGDNESLQTAIRDLASVSSSLDALVLNGDTVDQELEEQYRALELTLFKNMFFLPNKIIFNIGNHEFFDYSVEVNSPEEVQIFIRRYLDFTGEEKVYHDTWIKGYHFISLGSEDGNSATLDSIRAFISETQQEWLKEKLAEKYEKGKPIFVFLHQPLNSNPAGGWVGSDQGAEIKAILSAYPEVFLFTSHTHANLTETSIRLNQPYTAIHTGAIHYTILRRAQSQGGIVREYYGKGLYIEVKGDSVLVKGRDFKEKSWIFSQEIEAP